MEHINDHTIRDYDIVLDKEFGAPGTAQRIKAEEEALEAYSCQVLRDIRKEVKMTQAELAAKIGANKSYISRIERGEIIPSVGVFYRIISALGMQIQIVNPANAIQA